MEIANPVRGAYVVPTCSATAEITPALGVGVVVVPCFEDDDLADQPVLGDAVRAELTRSRDLGVFTAKPFELLTVAPRNVWGDRRIILVGAGDRGDWSADQGRRVAATGCLAARALRETRVGLVERGDVTEGSARLVQALVEGALIANFDGGVHKASDVGPSWIDEVAVYCRTVSDESKQAIQRGRVLGQHTNLARELANAPGNLMTPRMLAARAEAVAAEGGLSCEILNEADMAAHGMGLLLGVARGSDEPPRLIALRYDPPGAPETPVLGLVGKGVTFDTGGISLKAAQHMERMKDDMSGGAAVIAAMGAIAALGAPVRCVGVVPATENMPGGNAVKPGDVLRGAAGTTVEVINTDAEGRLVLGDGVWYARRLGATHLVDVATLTGACVVALGHTTSGLFGAPTSWIEHVRSAAAVAGERVWPMPTHLDYRDLLKSEIADMVNSAGREAGAISAAWFIGAFTGDLPWAHLDIAGTAWAEEPRPFQPKGATGAAVRTLVELALNADAWSRVGRS
jgi:leucyl aminopeptidase